MSSTVNMTFNAPTSAILVLMVRPSLLTKWRVLLVDSCTRKSLIPFVRTVYENFKSSSDSDGSSSSDGESSNTRLGARDSV